MKPSAGMLLLWAPRVLCILYAVFISLFALDAFSPNRRLWENLLALAMHLIPTAIILIVLALAWRWAWVGGILYGALGILYIITARGRFPWLTYLMISGPLFLTGALFFVSWIYREELAAGAVQSR
jgi:glucose-6-phosphate-specific signal transduction histidine kinase